MSDMYFDIPFRANDTLYNRGDLVAAPPGGHVSLAQIRISPANGYAGVYLPSTLDLTPYLGDRVVCLDSALKKHIGYIKSVGRKAVNTTYSNTDRGLQVSDNDNVDIGTNNITFFWRGRASDWTFATDHIRFFHKFQNSTNQWAFYILQTTGRIQFYAAVTGGTTISVATTVAPSLVDGVEYDICGVITRETASVAGSMAIYVNGNLFETVTIPAGTPANFNNTGNLYIAGYSGSRSPEIIHSAIMFNRPLSAAEVLSLHNSGGTPSIAAADQYGSQTSLVTGDNSTFASATGWWSKSAGVTIADGVCHFVNVGDQAGLFRNTQLVAAGRWVKVTYTISNLTEGGIRVAIYGPSYGPTHNANGTYTDYVLATSDSLGKVYIVGVGETSCDIDDVTVCQAGACLALEESGIGAADWQDSSSNNLDAAYPASGSAVVIFNNIVSTPGGTTYNWESKETGFNHTDSSGYTIEIDDVPGNGHVYTCTTPGTSGSTLPVFLLTVGSTTSDGGTVVWTECTPSGITWPGTPLTFSCAPKYGDYRRRKKYAQPISYSDGGDPYVYDKGLAARDIREITFQRFLTADLTKLLEFIEIVRGAKYRFSFYDELGVAHEVLILNADDITSAPVAPGLEGETSLKLLFL